MTCKVLRTWVATGVLSLCFAVMTPVAQAGFTISASVGGVPPTGLTYVNFDNLPLGSTGGTSNGITVSFTGTGEALQGSGSGSSVPYLSNNQGTLFGDPNNGPDGTTYLTTGIGTVTLTMPGQESYIGLLWGSVDTYNSLSFYEGSTLIGTVTGSQITSGDYGDIGPNGTYYVNITSTDSFDKVVATSTSYAFEFDNVAYVASVPEPSSFALMVAGAMGLVTYQQSRRKGSAGRRKG